MRYKQIKDNVRHGSELFGSQTTEILSGRDQDLAAIDSDSRCGSSGVVGLASFSEGGVAD